MNPSEWASLPSDACTLDTAGSFGPDRITKTLRDANGRPTDVLVAVGVTGQEATERTLAYNANGTLAHLIDANDNRTTYEYDGFDRLVKTRFPLPTLGSDSSSTTDYEQLTLDKAGNVTTRRLRDGNSIGYTYDALGRLTAKDLPGSEPDATYTYDLLNRMLTATQNSLVTTLTWDALGRRLTEATTGLGTVTSEYDLAGRRTKATLPGSTGLYADYLYDVLGNVTFIRENGATSGVGVLATYQYDSLSRRSSVTFGNGAVQGYTYDNAARLATQTNDLASTANDLTQTFSYTPASQISSVTRSNDLYAWTGHTNVDLDSTPNGLNQITNVDAATVTHDSKGNITAIGSDSYGYSSENFLTSGPASAMLGYDPMGRLYQVANGAGTTRMGYDGLDRIAEYDGSNAVQRRYIHGPGIDNPIAWYEGSGLSDRRFLSSDERGSVISATGSTTVLNKYDGFGVPQPGNSGKFGYTGQVWVPEIGLWYYKARFYRPDIGRFMQSDPTGYWDSPNVYAYVGNDPVNWIDPLGLTGLPNEDGGSGCDVDVCVTGAKIISNFASLLRSGVGGGGGGGGRDPCTTSVNGTPSPQQAARSTRSEVRNRAGAGARVGSSAGAGGAVIGAATGYASVALQRAFQLYPGSSWDPRHGDAGNRIYGAVTSALGIPRDFALRMSGLIEQFGRDSNSPYDPRDGTFTDRSGNLGNSDEAIEAIDEGRGCDQ